MSVHVCMLFSASCLLWWCCAICCSSLWFCFCLLRDSMETALCNICFVCVPMQSFHSFFFFFVVDGTVAPVQMSSSPLGSLSEIASKAMSPPCTSPVSPGNGEHLYLSQIFLLVVMSFWHVTNFMLCSTSEMSPCKESPLPQSPKVLDIPRKLPHGF